MAQQQLVELKGEEYAWDEDTSQYLCTHINARVEEACCSLAGSSGYIECACGGIDSVICENPDCTGIDDLFDQLEGGDEYNDQD